MKRGKLYAIGIGPGDPELMTLKAMRLLTEARAVCVPRGSEDGESMALGIAKRIVDMSGKEIIEAYFPMKKGSQREALMPCATRILSVMDSGTDVAFITLGDPVLYSTFFHLHDALLNLDGGRGIEVEIVPGVTSVTAAGARAGLNLALAGDTVAVLPATYMGDLGRVLEEFDTVVLMKVHRAMERVSHVLSDMGLLGRATYVARVGLDGETILPLADVRAEHLNYFSLVIVRK